MDWRWEAQEACRNKSKKYEFIINLKLNSLIQNGYKFCDFLKLFIENLLILADFILSDVLQETLLILGEVVCLQAVEERFEGLLETVIDEGLCVLDL